MTVKSQDSTEQFHGFPNFHLQIFVEEENLKFKIKKNTSLYRCSIAQRR